MSEKWKPIPGYVGYEASDHGRVRSSRRGDHYLTPRRILRPGVSKTKGAPTALVVSLMAPDGRPRTRRVHQLVMEAFVGPRPDGLVTCHWDGDFRNNRLDNLRYDTLSSNTLDSVRHGTHPRAASKGA